MKRIKKHDVQQGDVPLPAYTSVPAGAECIKKGAGIVIAEGEVTGHAHRVRGAAELFRAPDGQFYLVPDADTVIEHEEHGPIELHGGVAYRIGRVQERDHLERVDRQVRD